MSEPVIKERFQFEISRVKNNEEDLQETYKLRENARDAMDAVFAAKIALADAVIAAGGGYTRDDLVLVSCESRESVWVKFSGDEDATVVFEETPKDVVDRLTKGET